MEAFNSKQSGKVYIWWSLTVVCIKPCYRFVIFIAAQATFPQKSFSDLIKQGVHIYPNHPVSKGIFSINPILWEKQLLSVHCHNLPCIPTIVWTVRGIRTGLLFDSNVWEKRIGLLHLVPFFVHAITNQNDLKWSTNLYTSLIGNESRRSGLGAWCGFSLATKTPDTAPRGYPGHFPLYYKPWQIEFQLLLHWECIYFFIHIAPL